MKDSKWKPQLIIIEKPQDNKRRIQNTVKHLRWSFFAKINDCIQTLTIFTKHFILGVSQGCEYASDKTK